LPFVLDASVAACWCFHDEDDPRADAAYDLLYTEYALVPFMWWFEVCNVVLLGERRQRISEDHATNFLDQLGQCSIKYAPLSDHASILALARRHRLSFYDAVYLELAQREGVGLATLDNRLATAARTEGVVVVDVAP
jgi:predicted nucleic acid-binding protein